MCFVTRPSQTPNLKGSVVIFFPPECKYILFGLETRTVYLILSYLILSYLLADQAIRLNMMLLMMTFSFLTNFPKGFPNETSPNNFWSRKHHWLSKCSTWCLNPKAAFVAASWTRLGSPKRLWSWGFPNPLPCLPCRTTSEDAAQPPPHTEILRNLSGRKWDPAQPRRWARDLGSYLVNFDLSSFVPIQGPLFCSRAILVNDLLFKSWWGVAETGLCFEDDHVTPFKIRGGGERQGFWFHNFISPFSLFSILFFLRPKYANPFPKVAPSLNKQCVVEFEIGQEPWWVLGWCWYRFAF